VVDCEASPRPRAERRLALLERIALAPRQSLALVEAEGRRILVRRRLRGGRRFIRSMRNMEWPRERDCEWAGVVRGPGR